MAFASGVEMGCDEGAGAAGSPQDDEALLRGVQGGIADGAHVLGGSGVQEAKQRVSIKKLGIDGLEGGVWHQRIQCGHQPASLFPTTDDVGRPSRPCQTKWDGRE